MRSALSIALICRAAFAQTPAPEQLFREAVAAQRRGDDEAAIGKYRELLRLQPDVPQVRANLGAALAHAGRYDEAIEQYKLALEANPGEERLSLNLALAYYKKGDAAKAAAELRLLHDKTPSDSRVATLLGDCYGRMGRDADAVAVLLRAEDAHPDDPGVAWALGAVLIHEGRLRDGLRRVQAVAAGGKSAEANLLAGQTLVRLDEFESARTYAAAAKRLNPRLPGIYTLSGRIEQYLGDYAAAKVDLGKALEADPNDFQAHVTLAAILNSERDLDGAAMHIGAAMRLEPESPLARYELARLERTKGDLDAAARDFERAIAANPGWLQPHVELAALYYRLNRPEDGARERAIVDKLSAAGPNARTPSP